MESLKSPKIIDYRNCNGNFLMYFPDLIAKTSLNASDPHDFQPSINVPKIVADLKVKKGDIIELVENHCLYCRRRLCKNGTNEKVCYEAGFDKGKIFLLQRYICKECGEICIDYDEFFKNKSKYDGEMPENPRLIFALGIPPCKIREIII